MTNSWRKTASYVALDRPEYLFELDEHRDDDGNQVLFVHLTVHDWSPSTLKRLLREFKAFREHVQCPLYALNPDQDEKWEHFVSLFGFRPLLDEVVCANGERRRLYIQLKEENGSRHTKTKPDAADVEHDELVPVVRTDALHPAGL